MYDYINYWCWLFFIQLKFKIHSFIHFPRNPTIYPIYPSTYYISISLYMCVCAFISPNTYKIDEYSCKIIKSYLR